MENELKKRKNSKVKIENTYKEHRLLLNELLNLEVDDLKFKLKTTIDVMYEDQVEDVSEYVSDVIRFIGATDEDNIRLPYDLIVLKNDDALTFKFEKTKKAFPLFILFGIILVLSLLSATYFGMLYLQADEDGDNNDGQVVDPSGNPSNDIYSGHLNIVYEEVDMLVYEDLIPDDMGNVYYPEQNFTITNLSNFDAVYKMTFVVENNTFTSDNFKYMLTSDNKGLNLDYTVAPWEDVVLEEFVSIPALTTQNYTITFKLEGLNEPQNYDQGKNFKGYIKIGD